MKKLLVLSAFLMIGLVFLLSNPVNATTTIEYIDSSVNIKYLLDEETKVATAIGYVEPVAENIEIPSKIIKDDYEYIVKKIDDSAFLQCDTVKNITIPKTVTSIGKNVFNRCDYLEEINIENGNTTYSSVEGVLFNYDKTELIRYPGGKKEDIYIIPSDVIQISELAFWHNQLLENIVIPDTVTKIGANAFQFCTSLESIVIPKGVTSIESFTFDSCSSLTSIIIPDSVTSIGTYAFYGCSSLIDLNIPDSVVYLEDKAFYNSILENKIYYVKNSLSNLSSNNIKNFIRIDDDGYETRLIANEGYKLPQNISIKINTIELSLNDYEYDFITGELKIGIDKINGDIEIEAIGNKIHKVIFDANEGKFSEGNNILKFDDAEKIDFDKLEQPTKDGYKFIGYYTEKVGGTSLVDIMNSEAGIESDLTFYARWEDNSSEGDSPIQEDEEKKENINSGNIEIDDNNNTENVGSDNNNNTGNTDSDDNTIMENTSQNINIETENIPDTGDNIITHVVILIIAIIGIVKTTYEKN